MDEDGFDFYVLRKAAELHEGRPCWKADRPVGNIRLAYSGPKKCWEVSGFYGGPIVSTTTPGLPFEADLAWRGTKWSYRLHVGAMPVLGPGASAEAAAVGPLLRAIEVAHEPSGPMKPARHGPDRVVIIFRDSQSTYSGEVLPKSSELDNGSPSWECPGVLKLGRNPTGHWSITRGPSDVATSQRSLTSPIGIDVAWQKRGWSEVVAVLPWGSGDTTARVAAALRLPVAALQAEVAALQNELAAVRDGARSQVAALQAENSRLRGEQDGLAAQAAEAGTLRDERDKLAAEMAEIRGRVDVLFDELSPSRRSMGLRPLA